MAITPEKRRELLLRKRELLIQQQQAEEATKTEQKGFEVLSKVGGLVSPILGAVSPATKALEDPTTRGIAKVTAAPITAATLGGLPGLTGLGAGTAVFAGLRQLPRVSEVKPVKETVEKLPEEGIPDIISKAAPLVSPVTGALTPGLKFLEKPKKKTKQAIDFAQTGAEILAAVKAGLGAERFVRTRISPLIARAGGIVTKIKAGREAARQIKILQQQSDDLATQISQTKENVQARAKLIKEKIDIDRQALAASLEDDITREASKASLKTQKELQRMIGENSDFYGSYLDDIEQNLSNIQRSQLNSVDVQQVLQGSLDEATEALIAEGKSISGLKQLIKKYGGPPRPVNLRELLRDLSNLKKTLSAGVRGGTKLFTADEIPVEIARKNVGVYLDDVIEVQGLRELNESYRQVLEVTKKANVTFKPYKGPLERKAGTQFIKRTVKKKPGTVAPEEEEFFGRLKTGEKGFAKGVGDVDEVARNIQEAGQARLNQLKARGLKVTQAEKNIIEATKKLSNAIKQNRMTISELNEVVAGGKRAETILKRIGVGGAILAASRTSAGKNILRNLLAPAIEALGG